MACNSCKQKRKVSTQVPNVSSLNGFELREGLTFEMIGVEPNEEAIIGFLKQNPNRVSLFEKLPDLWNNKKIEDDEINANQISRCR